ncbi:iron ABC transporter substrate-binding protein [uncultured Methanobacterium sp.]|uniref:iron ABC transporter substrate-binding protein n=1 Tax=uncultured Methanobacterium sp. TaxID=176306 RepID=UPI002AA8F5E7|nr:iron ABC transporter substrate-binding protein [uncultured Methanobacterium sp.]
MKNQKIIIIAVIAIVAILGVLAYLNYYQDSNFNGGQITDMAGRTVDVPADINKTYSSAGSVTIILYMLAPDKMIGWNSLNGTQNYMQAQYKNLPILGGGQSQGNNANLENIISNNPDVVFTGHSGGNDTINRMQQKFGSIPVLDVEGDNNLTSLDSAIKFMGTVLHVQSQSNDLISFNDKMLNQVKGVADSIPDSEKKKVYYARGDDGLTTFAPGSPNVQLITLCGGKNVVEAPVSNGGMGVSMESVLNWNPDVIITSSSQFYSSVYSNSAWQGINAVKNKQVYLTPQDPFNWFESPPGANTIIGIPWTAKVLYPDKFSNIDLNSLTKEFYSKYYHYNLTDSDVSNIITSSGLKS